MDELEKLKDEMEAKEQRRFEAGLWAIMIFTDIILFGAGMLVGMLI